MDKDNLINKVIFNKYRILRKIGEGSFGKVFLVKKQEKNYAVKIIKIDKTSLSYAEKELVILKTIKHENIVLIHDGFLEDGRVFLILE